MLKFFRKIRQRLLNEGKSRQYLVYAMGEILLVMIGILLALQVNNWNEKNKERQHQMDQLSNLRMEVVSMKAFLKGQIKILKDAEVSNALFLKLMDADASVKIIPDSINRLLYRTLNTDFVTEEKLSFETIVDFKLLPEEKYAQLNEQLLDWKHFVGRIAADFQLIEDNRENDLQKSMMDVGVTGWMVLYTNFKASNFSIDYHSLLRSKEVYAFLYYRYVRLNFLKSDIDEGLIELDKMLSVLNDN